MEQYEEPEYEEPDEAGDPCPCCGEGAVEAGDTICPACRRDIEENADSSPAYYLWVTRSSRR